MRGLRTIAAVVFVGAVTSAILPERLMAQDGANRRWSLTLALGQQVGGPASDLEGAMRDGGFAATTECWLFCEGNIEHPWTSGPGLTGLIAVRYALHPRFSVEALYATGGEGQTFGSAGELLTLIVSHSVTTVAAIASTTFRPVEREGRSGALRVGVGPALYSIKAGRFTGGRTTGENTSTRIGFLVDSGLELPDRSRVFLDLRAQWRYAGSEAIGPFEVGFLNLEPKTLPETDASCNHFFFSVGMGVRL